MPESKTQHSRLEPDSLDRAVNLITGLIDTRNFRKERLLEPDIANALADIGRSITAENDPAKKLQAVSLLGKSGEISKPIALAVQGYLERGLRSPIPPIGNWGNADDRYYLAKGVSVSQGLWVSSYAAEELARAEIAEKASREVWAQLAISRADTLTHVLQTAADALAKQLADLNGTVDTAYRKLVRICDTLSSTLLMADIPTGSGFGRAFSNLVLQAGGGTGAESLRLREDAAATVLDLVVKILRLRFDTLFDPEIYRSVGRIRSWWRPGRPPDSVEDRANRIAQLAFDGLHILARQGVQDRELRQVIVTALGVDRVNRAGELIANGDPSLPPHISHWLATGKVLEEVRANTAVEELNQREVDELLGRLLLTLQAKEAGAPMLRIIADDIEAMEPAHAAALKLGADRLDLVDQWVNALATARQLERFGERGDIVEFDPAMHESTTPVARLAPVRISAPGVLRSLSGRPPTMLFKTIVEKV